MLNKIIALLIYWALIGLKLSFRFRVINQPAIDKIRSKKTSYIVALWHQNLIHSTLSHSAPHATMASNSKDGDLITAVLHHLGYKVARGSSSKGGRRGIVELIRFVRQGYPAAVTVDGPQGPFHEPKNGIFSLAKACKVPIVPYVVYPEKFWAANNWDNFRVPLPFSRVCLYLCDPIFVNQDTGSENFPELAKQVKQALEEGELKAIAYLKANPG